MILFFPPFSPPRRSLFPTAKLNKRRPIVRLTDPPLSPGLRPHRDRAAYTLHAHVVGACARTKGFFSFHFTISSSPSSSIRHQLIFYLSLATDQRIAPSTIIIKTRMIHNILKIRVVDSSMCVSRSSQSKNTPSMYKPPKKIIM